MRSPWILRPRLTDKGEPYLPELSLYNFVQGDVFYPGVGNFAFQYYQALPLHDLKGQATYGPNPINPIQGAQRFSPNIPVISGIGGPLAGTFVSAPLWDNEIE
jgi:hypothetical protein